MKKVIIIFISFLFLGTTFAQTPSLNTAYTSFLKAEEAFANNDNKKALVYYKDAMIGYMSSLSGKPDLLPEEIKKRMKYCQDQLVIVRERIENPTPVVEEETAEVVQSEVSKIDQIINHTKEALAKNDLSTAKAMAIRGIQVEPTNTEIRFLAAVVQCKLGKYADSTAILTQLAKELPDSAKIQTTLGVSYMAQNNLQDAKTALRQAILNDPELPDTYINMAQLLLLENPPNMPMAWANYNKAIELGSQKVPTLEAKLSRKTVKYVTVEEKDSTKKTEEAKSE
ncbi:MAG: tetratricopeptide repeat protein [Kiritimatiellae bacterium]|nr:tetratricopeptide repeat protein [Kiritimatiellia bacterium]